MGPRIDLCIECEGWHALPDLETLATEVITACAGEIPQQKTIGAEVSLLFCDDAAIRLLNKTWRGKDMPTNVLSFPVAAVRSKGPARMLGDIVLAYETTAGEAAEGAGLRDHTAHLIAHGFLHLLGYDHENDSEAETMESAERRILSRLGIADPYTASA